MKSIQNTRKESRRMTKRERGVEVKEKENQREVEVEVRISISSSRNPKNPDLEANPVIKRENLSQRLDQNLSLHLQMENAKLARKEEQ